MLLLHISTAVRFVLTLAKLMETCQRGGRRPAKADTGDERKTIWLWRKVGDTQNEKDREREIENGPGGKKRERDTPSSLHGHFEKRHLL
jgi:hypothetical protein